MMGCSATGKKKYINERRLGKVWATGYSGTLYLSTDVHGLHPRTLNLRANYS